MGAELLCSEASELYKPCTLNSLQTDKIQQQLGIAKKQQYIYLFCSVIEPPQHQAPGPPNQAGGI